jgi:hypothetical protein
MHTIETRGIVTADHQLVVNSTVPEDIRPGEHKVTLTIDTAEPEQRHRGPFFRPAYAVGLTSDESTFRREDIYDDVDR